MSVIQGFEGHQNNLRPIGICPILRKEKAESRRKKVRQVSNLMILHTLITFPTFSYALRSQHPEASLVFGLLSVEKLHLVSPKHA